MCNVQNEFQLMTVPIFAISFDIRSGNVSVLLGLMAL